MLIGHRELAPNAAVRTMTFGDQQQERYGEISKEVAFNVLDTFYANGEWMAARGNRDQMVVVTKYPTPFRKTHTDEVQSNFVGNWFKSMRLSLEASLKKLQTSYIDLFYEFMHMIALLGLSAQQKYARDHGLRPLVLYQSMWNAAIRDFECDIIPSLNQGRFQTQKGFEERDKHNPGRQLILTSSRDNIVSVVLEKLAERKSYQLVQVALAHCSQKTPYVFPIVSGRRVEHIQVSMDGLLVGSTYDDIAEIEKAYPFDLGLPHTFFRGTLFKGADQLDQRPVEGPGDISLTKTGGNFNWVPQPRAIRQKLPEPLVTCGTTLVCKQEPNLS
ncbi:sterigmatocystin biosynthesis dehydrogenase stcV [Lipomyces doorenjongii]